MRWREERGEPAWGCDPDQVDFDAIRRFIHRMRPIYGPDRAYFRTEVQGWENVPDAPCLMVGNHSGGTSIPDVWGLGISWYRHFGDTRPIHSLAHEMVFALDGVGKTFAGYGILRASREMAIQVLSEKRRDLMVYPGGDLETWRPWKDRYKVCFNGRTGYAKLAIQTGASVVPVAHAGAHDTLVVLSDGRRLAERLHFPELFRAHIFPVHLSLPFGLGIGPTPHLPPPTRLRYRIGRPVVPPRWLGEGDPPRQMVLDYDRSCRAELQRMLDILRDEHEGLRDRLRHRLRRWRGRGQPQPSVPMPIAAK